jgi:hypothetical protein
MLQRTAKSGLDTSKLANVATIMLSKHKQKQPHDMIKLSNRPVALISGFFLQCINKAKKTMTISDTPMMIEYKAATTT